MLTVVLIRHGKTIGNLQKRYLGRTDESLCIEGITELESLVKQKLYPPVDAVYTSPMKRCIETANIIYPEAKVTTIEGLKECDFGLFEYKTYEALKEDKSYQTWLDSAGEGQIPGGESAAVFRSRCCNAFAEAMKDSVAVPHQKIAMVLHGGSMMAILAKFAQPEQEFYAWQVANGHGVILDMKNWLQNKRFAVIQKI